MPPEATTATTVVSVPEISREELRRGLKSGMFKVIDVLPAESYANGHIPGSISLPVPEITARARELLPDPNAHLIVYCAKFT